jgi:Caspase domain
VEPPREPPFDVQSPVVEMYCEEYNMGHPRRGIALILNHMKFETEEDRHGSDKDCERLIAVLTNLGFEVRVKTDLTFDKVLSVLKSRTLLYYILSFCVCFF